MGGDVFAMIMDQQQQIKDAVISAFRFDPVFCSEFKFTVSVTRSISTSPEERAGLILDGLREFKVPKDFISAAQQHLTRSLIGEGADDVAIKEEVTSGGTAKNVKRSLNSSF